MKRRDFISLAAAGAAAAAVMPGAACGGGGKRPNIIFIMADDLGYGHLGCYGQEKIRTPHIDRLAAEGMKFTQCYSGSPVCAPSRSVLMTGMHCGHTSVRDNPGGTPLLASDITVGEVLKKAGYATGIFGKWGLGDIATDGVPCRHGFDRFFGYLHQVHCHFYYPYFLWDGDRRYYLPGNYLGKRGQYTHDVIVEKALDWLREQKDNRFFLYLPFTIPHTELLVPEDSFNEYKGVFPEPKPWVDPNHHYADQPYPRTTFAAMVTRMDRDVGRLMGLLKELGLDDNTIVIFTSDNGGQGTGGPDLQFFKGNGPLRAGKGVAYEGGIRVPTIARWPGMIGPGTVSDHVWAFQDVMPTLAELAGARIGHEIDGVSAVPAIVGEEKAGHRQEIKKFFYWEIPAGGNLMQAVRMGDWKGVRMGPDRPLELYNLAEDIGETNDVAGSHSEIVAEITDYLKTARIPPREYDPEPPAWGFPREHSAYMLYERG